jgi:hypothetical protein
VSSRLGTGNSLTFFYSVEPGVFYNALNSIVAKLTLAPRLQTKVTLYLLHREKKDPE